MADYNVQPSRFSRTKYFPQSSTTAVERFLSLFHRYGYIYKPFGGRGWFSADEKWKLTDTEILKAIACVHPKYMLGTRAGRASYYAVLDIDAGSRYHNRQGLQRINKILADAGIEETNLYRSSESGGWHLYIFFDAPVSSRDLRAQLYNLLRLHDFEIGKGTLEIFPHPGEKSLGQGLRLPLQEGFAWLNQDTLVERHERQLMSPLEALEQFLADFECSSNPYHSFHRLKTYVSEIAAKREQIVAITANATKLAEVIPIRNSVYCESTEESIAIVKRSFQKVPPGIIADSWVRGRNYYYVGLTAHSQRADAITCLSHYLFYGDPERLLPAMGYGYEEDRKWVIQEVLQTKHNGFSKDIGLDRADGLDQAERAANWVPPRRRGKETTKYENNVPISWVKNNENRSALARKKIQAAVADFEEAGQTFSMRDLMLKTGCAANTVSKHKDIWKPVQDRLQQVCLASDPHEYNAGEGVASQESRPPASDRSKIVPPGLLVARRVVYELKMREERTRKFDWKSRVARQKAQECGWKSQLLGITPEDFGKCEEIELRRILAVYLSALARSPDLESEVWLRGLIERVRLVLESRPIQLRILLE